MGMSLLLQRSPPVLNCHPDSMPRNSGPIAQSLAMCVTKVRVDLAGHSLPSPVSRPVLALPRGVTSSTLQSTQLSVPVLDVAVVTLYGNGLRRVVLSLVVITA